jgi:universal stress protein A
MNLNRIVVPVDFSAASLNALEFAADVAKPVGAELVLLFVIEPVLRAVSSYQGATAGTIQQMARDQRRAWERQLARLERRYTKRGSRVRSIIGSGAPASAIVELAQRSKADLIIIATHGRTGVARLLMGSVAERVVRTATCPVLTLHGGSAPARTKRVRSAAPALPLAPRRSARRSGEGR